MIIVKRSWERNWIVLCAIVVHAVWGLVLLVSPAPLYTTPLGLIHSVRYLDNQYVAAALYLTASGLALIPVVWQKYDTRFSGLLLSSMQQFLLMVSFFTALIAIILGQYPDGYAPSHYGSPRLFIFVDQLWPMVGMMCHTISLIDWYWISRLRAVEE